MRGIGGVVKTNERKTSKFQMSIVWTFDIQIVLDRVFEQLVVQICIVAEQIEISVAFGFGRGWLDQERSQALDTFSNGASERSMKLGLTPPEAKLTIFRVNRGMNTVRAVVMDICGRLKVHFGEHLRIAKQELAYAKQQELAALPSLTEVRKKRARFGRQRYERPFVIVFGAKFRGFLNLGTWDRVFEDSGADRFYEKISTKPSIAVSSYCVAMSTRERSIYLGICLERNQILRQNDGTTASNLRKRSCEGR